MAWEALSDEPDQHSMELNPIFCSPTHLLEGGRSMASSCMSWFKGITLLALAPR